MNPKHTDHTNLETIYEGIQTGEEIVQQAAPKVAALNKTAPPKSAMTVEDEDDFLDDLEANSDEGLLGQYIDTDLPTFNYRVVDLFLRSMYETKNSLLIYGEPGLGKSAVVTSFAVSMAKSKGKQFVNWNKASVEEQRAAIEEPGKYFVLIDVRTAGLDPTDLNGIPDIYEKLPYLSTKQPRWVYVLSQPDADGILFLDELNQGSRQVLNALFEVVYDRTAGGRSFSKHFGIVGAGNLDPEHGNEPLPPALVRRFDCGVLIADPDAWMKWAEANGINKYIVAFVKSDPTKNFFVKAKNPSDPYPSPAAMVKCSGKLASVNQMFKEAKAKGEKMPLSKLQMYQKVAAAACGEAWSRSFVTFVQYIRNYSLRDIIEGADKLSSEKADKLLALVVFLSGKIRSYVKLAKEGRAEEPEAQEIIKALSYVTVHIVKDWRTTLWTDLRQNFDGEDFRYILSGIAEFVKTAGPEIKTKVSTAVKDIAALLQPEKS